MISAWDDLLEILHSSPVDYYSASGMVMLDYPYRLGRVGASVSPTIVDKSEKYILDSAIGDTDVGNENVLSRGKEVGAETILPADEFFKPEETTDAVLDMLFLLDEEPDYSPTLMIPLQAPKDTGEHWKHYLSLSEELESYGWDLSEFPVALGGVKDANLEVQLDAAIRVRELAGEGQYIHGLGFGYHNTWIPIIRRCPWLLDSVDNSTVSNSVPNGRVFDTRMESRDWGSLRGKKSTSLISVMKTYQMFMWNYLIGPHVRETDTLTTLDMLEPERRSDVESMLETHIQNREDGLIGMSAWRDVAESQPPEVASDGGSASASLTSPVSASEVQSLASQLPGANVAVQFDGGDVAGEISECGQSLLHIDDGGDVVSIPYSMVQSVVPQVE